MSEHSTKCQIETIEYSLVPLKTNLLKVVTLNAVGVLTKRPKGILGFYERVLVPIANSVFVLVDCLTFNRNQLVCRTVRDCIHAFATFLARTVRCGPERRGIMVEN